MTIEEFMHVVFDETDHLCYNIKVHDTDDEKVFQESKIEPEVEKINEKVPKLETVIHKN